MGRRSILAITLLGSCLCFCVIAGKQNLVDCARALDLQPYGSRGPTGASDIVLPTFRNGKAGLYFYSDDKPVFVPFVPTPEELKAGLSVISFRLPPSGHLLLGSRVIHLVVSNFNPTEPSLLTVSPLAAGSHLSPRAIQGVEPAYDEPAKSVLDQYLAKVIPQRADAITRYSNGLGLTGGPFLKYTLERAGFRLPFDVTSIGLDNPKTIEKIRSFLNNPQNNQAQKVQLLADAYASVAPSLIDVNTVAIGALGNQINQNCQVGETSSGVGKATTVQAQLAITKLTRDAGINVNQIRPGISTKVRAQLFSDLQKLSQKGVTNPTTWSLEIAGSVTRSVNSLRQAAERNLASANYSLHQEGGSAPVSPATH